MAAPTGRAPYAVMLMAETRPSKARGVIVWRSVAVLITQMIGPTPIRKKLSPASTTEGVQIGSNITTAAASPANGPRAKTAPERPRTGGPRGGDGAGHHAD